MGRLALVVFAEVAVNWVRVRVRCPKTQVHGAPRLYGYYWH